MKIGDAAKISGLSTKAIRYYEMQGLVSSYRLQNGYRDYSNADLKALSFIHHARELGFSIGSCRDLLALLRDPHRASAAVKEVAQQRLREIEQQREKLNAMQTILESLINLCPGDDSPDCAILEELARDSN